MDITGERQAREKEDRERREAEGRHVSWQQRGQAHNTVITTGGLQGRLRHAVAGSRLGHHGQLELHTGRRRRRHGGGHGRLFRGAGASSVRRDLSQ